MPLSALPAVLVQSLMHSLSAQEILKLARCSKWTLQCANDAFAWRDCPALALQRFDEKSPVPPHESRLSRWIPLALCAKDDGLREAAAERLLALMQSCPRILHLEWYRWVLPVERGLQLLTHPSMQSVRCINICRFVRAEWIAAAALLPCLSELNLSQLGLEASTLLPLIHARDLRKLFVSETHVERLSVVMQLTQITQLVVYLPQLTGTNFLAFCTAMSGLEELQLHSWFVSNVRSISSADLAAGFAALRSLRILCFGELFDEETLAPVLHLAPALRLLSLPYFARYDFIRLAQLSLAAPMLNIQLSSHQEQKALQAAKKAIELIVQ